MHAPPACGLIAARPLQVTRQATTHLTEPIMDEAQDALTKRLSGW
jgi:hypothetical protein